MSLQSHQNPQIAYDAQQTRLREEMSIGKHSVQQAQRIFDTYKRQGDTAFKAVRYEEAIHAYTMALIVRPDPVTYANRSLAHFKCESYGSALDDGKSSVQLDPGYTKGFYRIGVCEFAMHNYDKAIEAFAKVLSLSPSEAGARQQLAAARKAYREQQFAQALSDDGESSPSSAPLNVHGFFPLNKGINTQNRYLHFFDKLNWNLKVDPVWRGVTPDLSIDYLGEGIHTDGKIPLQFESKSPNAKRRLTSRKYTREFVLASIEWFAADRSKDYPKIFVYHILKDFSEMIKSLPTVVDYNIPTLDDIDCTQAQAERYIEGEWSDMESDDGEDDEDDESDMEEEENNDHNEKSDKKSQNGENVENDDKNAPESPKSADKSNSTHSTASTDLKKVDSDADKSSGDESSDENEQNGDQKEQNDDQIAKKTENSMEDVPTPSPIPTMCDSTPPPVHGTGDVDIPLLDDEENCKNDNKKDGKKDEKDENDDKKAPKSSKKSKKSKKSRPDPMYSVYQQGKLNVCGDTHGQFWDLLNIFKLQGNPGPLNPYLFNGDYVDRGSFGYELILTLMLWKLHCPIALHMTRGNHETINMNRSFGFYGEVIHKADDKIFDCFTQAFNMLPLAYVLGDRVLILHGGLFSDENATLNDLRAIDRFRQPPESGGLMVDCLWSDPHPFFKGRRASVRGAGCQFGSDITRLWLRRNNLDLIVRSHEMKAQGYEVTHEGKLVTIFSAPNYCVAEGTRVTLLDGTANQIQTFSTQSPTKVLSFQPNSTTTTVNETVDWMKIEQGVKDVVKIKKMDGISVISTPDHQFFTKSNQNVSKLDQIDETSTETTFKRADQLERGDLLYSTVEGVDISMDFDSYKTKNEPDFDFSLKINQITYNSRHTSDRAPIYAFCRLLGLVFSQETLNNNPNGVQNVEKYQKMAKKSLFLRANSVSDIESIITDLQTAFSLDSRPSFTVQGSHYSVEFNFDHFLMNLSFEGCFPSFLFEFGTPRAFIREFLSAYLSQIVISPQFDPITSAFTPLSASVGVGSAQIEELMGVLGLQGLILKKNVQNGAEMDKNDLHCAKMGEKSRSNHTLDLLSSDLSVLEHYYTTVGMRYAAEKLSELAIAVTWGRIERTEAQNDIKIAQDIENSTQNAENDTKIVNLTQNSQFSLTQFISSIKPSAQYGFASWLVPVEGVEDCNGAMETFDLTVANTHLFIANGSVVHNCDTMGNKGAIMTFDHKYGFTFTQFEAVNHPPVRAMFYADPYLR